MTTDALTETVVDEAEAIVRAEFMRLQQAAAVRDQVRRAVRRIVPGVRTVTVGGATLDLARQPPTRRRAGGCPPRSGPQQRVWPTQRSPPRSCGSCWTG